MKLRLTRKDLAIGAGILIVLFAAFEFIAAEKPIGGKLSGQVFLDAKVAALARSACHGDRGGVARAVRGGANPNGPGYDGVTPLYWAMACKNLAGTEALLEAGSDPNLKFGGDFSATHLAAGMPDPDYLKIMLRHHGDPNAFDARNGSTALTEALQVGITTDKWDNYYALLNGGADINLVDNNHTSALMVAAANSRYDKVAELIERGYSQNLQELAIPLAMQLAIEDDYRRRQVPGASAQALANMGKVKQLLIARGIDVPARP
ncbi:MAG: ankyrin repeat domain-containing protein [Alphaproteobacteria bacterium]